MIYKFLDEWMENTIINSLGLKEISADWHLQFNPKTSNTQPCLVSYIWVVDVRDPFLRRGFTLAGMLGRFEEETEKLNRAMLIMSSFEVEEGNTDVSPGTPYTVDLGESDPVAAALDCIPLITHPSLQGGILSPIFQVMTFNGAGNNFFQFDSHIINDNVLNLWNAIWETTRTLVDSIGDKDMKETYLQHYYNFPHRVS